MPLFRKITQDEAHEIMTPDLLRPYLEVFRNMETGDWVEVTLSDEDLARPRTYSNRLGMAARRCGVRLTRKDTAHDNVVLYKVRRIGEPSGT
jgi:hypothetical protein